VAVGNTVSLIEVMQSFTPIVAEQAGVRNPAAFPGEQLIRFEDATCAPCHAGSQVDSKENCNCCRGIEYSVLEVEPGIWKWTFRIGGDVTTARNRLEYLSSARCG
jgi:hypothetical protein